MGIPVGTRLGPYEIVAPLGAGGMGEVYKAHDERLGRTVAIKVLGSHRELTDELRRRFLHEARTLSAFNHPNIVTLYDIGQHQGRDYLVMEYVAGRTLDQLLGRRGQPVAQALKYAIPIADALAQAHAAGILHRDLKPSNVIVTDEGVVKVLDFGLAKLVNPPGSADIATEAATVQMTGEGVVAGTPAYMSPEQVEGKPLDARSDIFSFGALLYEMVTGGRAFAGDSAAAVMAAVLREDPRTPAQMTSDLPADLEKLIQRCLRKDPAKRVQSMADVRAQLDDLREQTTSAAHSPVAAPVREPARRRLLVTVAAVGLVAALVAGLWITWRPRKESSSEAPGVPGPLTAVPLTSYVGSELDPSLSPDGSQVAYSADIEDKNNFDIYVQVVGSSAPPLRLTHDPVRDHWPSWSPDGRWILFNRGFAVKESKVMRVSPLGGRETVVAEERCLWLSWSPDSQWVVCGGTLDRPGLWAMPPDGRKQKTLTQPPSGYTDAFPVISPAGTRLLFLRSGRTMAKDLYELTIDAAGNPVGEARLVRKFPLLAGYLAWTPDGRELLLSMGDQKDNLPARLFRLRVDESDSMPVPLNLPEGAISRSGIAREGRRLVYAQSISTIDIWQSTDKAVERHPVSSTRSEWEVQFSTDSTRIAFGSDRSGAWEVWVAQADGTQAEQLTSIGAASHPHWSPDGKQLVFERKEQNGHMAIYLIATTGGPARRLTDGAANDRSPSLSRDGQWIYFSSDRTGRAEIFHMDLDGREVKQVTRNGGEYGEETMDGKRIVFARWRPGERSNYRDLWEVPVAGGPERQLPIASYPGGFAVGPAGIYFRSLDDAQKLLVYDPATGMVHPFRDKPEGMGEFAVSPDGRTIIFTKTQTQSDLMLVDNFR